MYSITEARVHVYAWECSIAEHESYAMMCMLGIDGPDGAGRQSAELGDAARGPIGISLISAGFEGACLRDQPLVRRFFALNITVRKDG